jgi:hypothetical protein
MVMKLREARSATTLGLLAVALLIAVPAAPLEIHIGGVDANSQYTGAGLPVTDAGIFTFDDQSNPMNTPELGRVTSYDLPALNLIQGLNHAKVNFQAILGPTSQLGTDFDPATGSVAQAIFLGTPGPDLYFLDPIDGMTVLLAFDLDYIEVTQTGWANAADPDGRIVLGDSTAAATSSRLVVAGGSLNYLVGGIGTGARLEVTFATLTPPILVRGDRIGYLNTNFLSGYGAPPVATTVWNLTIIPEPSTAVLLGFALLGVVAAARRKVAR